jgi:endonuclease/exonuclease/phosphatase family metal-dependent hydrolase
MVAPPWENAPVAFDPYAPYGPVADGTCRVATWNVWGRFGDWLARQEGITAELRRCEADVVCLDEAWETPHDSQIDIIGSALGLGHQISLCDFELDGWRSGIGICSRWPIARYESRALPGGGDGLGTAALAVIDGPRGPVQVIAVMLDYPLHASGVRQRQVRELLGFVSETTSRRHLTVICGDFNAGPDADEIRMLTGRSEPLVPGMVFYDAWEVGGDGGTGITWSNDNPLAAVGLIPDRRLDYILSAWPRRGGIGHPTACERLGVRPAGDLQLSDHYGIVADLRY